MTGPFTTYFYHRTTRKVITAFASMFSEVQIARSTLDGLTEKDRFTVKLVMGQKEKYFNAIKQDPTKENPLQSSLPIMSLEWKGLAYAPQRKQISTQRISHFNDTQGNLKQYMGVPYDLKFTLSVLVRNIDDGIQILEQILPNFTPDYTLSIDIDKDIGITKQFPVTLDNISYAVENEGGPETMRLVMFEYTFTVQAWYFPMTTDPAIIKTAITNIYRTTDSLNLLTILNVSANGNGVFQDLETVYQGPDQATSFASAQVAQWDTINRKLYIKGITGDFQSNTIVVGANTNAQWNVASILPSAVARTLVTVTPNPPTANKGDPFQYVVQIQEYLD